MGDQDRYIVSQILEQEHVKNAPALTLDKYFETFTAEQVLKTRSFDLDPEQIQSGIIGNGGDGGVDSLYVFANRKLIREDTDLGSFAGQQVAIELVILQAKNQDSFKELVIKNFVDFTENCLRLNADLGKVSTALYSQALLDVVGRFHQLYRGSLSQRPTLSISFCYVSLGDRVDKKVETRANLLLEKIRECYSISTPSCEFVGAKTLLAWYYQAPTKTLQLRASKELKWSGFGSSYIVLVQLPEFYRFITDKGQLRGHVFEANVRDYQGDVQVNKDIAETLNEPGSEEFWWLNNGITILASAATPDGGDSFTITDPLIVNGLQTSYEIYDHFQKGRGADDKRTILVRIIVSTDSQSVDRIIKATNSQTKIPRVWLHATEDIHRKIESVLSSASLYYDRRKNYHRNQGVSAAAIVTIPYLAQALASIVLQKPDDARARPTTVAERHYKKLFSQRYPIELYSKSALVLKRVEEYLDGLDVARGHKLNVMFYLAMYATCVALKSPGPRRTTIAELDISKFDDALLADCYKQVKAAYDKLGGDDHVAKGTQLVAELNRELRAKFRAMKRTGS